jgi:hypothetical protein
MALLATGGGPRNRHGLRVDQWIVEDLMVALGWIGKSHVVELLLAKYGGQDARTQKVLHMMRKRWGPHGVRYKLTPKQMDELCLLALAEHLDPRCCGHCKGTGVVVRETKGSIRPVTCPSCWGNGRFRYSIRRKAFVIGIHKNTWGNRRIEALYTRILSSLSSWESYGWRRLRKSLRTG